MAEEKGGLYRVFDVLGKIAALALLLSMAFETIVTLLFSWGVEISGDTLATIVKVKDFILTWGAIGLASIVALEFGFKHNLLTLIIALVVIALVVLPRFFGDIWAEVEEAIAGNAS